MLWWRRLTSFQWEMWVIHQVSGVHCWGSGDKDGSPQSISRIKVKTQVGVGIEERRNSLSNLRISAHAAD